MKGYSKLLVAISALICTLGSGISDAQPKFDNERILSQYGNYNAVFLIDEENFVIDIVDSELSVTQYCNQQVLSLRDAGILFSQDRVYYSSFTKIEDLEASSWVPNGRSYRQEKVKDFTETDSRSGSVFYDDSRVIRFSYPSLGKGAVTSLRYKTVYNDPRFISSFFLREGIPVDKKRVVFKVHPDVELRFKVVNGDKVKYDFREYEKGKYRYFEWTVDSSRPYKQEDPGDLRLYYSPHIVFHIGRFSIDGRDSTLFSNEADLYNYYYSLVSSVQNECTEDMRRVAEDLTRNMETDRQKAGAILTWVQDNIKYVAFEEGMRGFIPDPGQDVFVKRYGDCKDMASLIRQMLECIGIEAHYGWVGTRTIPYSYREIPTPRVDNHMVAVYIENDSLFVLDGTIDHMIIGAPPEHIQGKELLVSLGKDNYMIHKIPVMPESYSSITDSVIVKIEGAAISGRGDRSFKGYNRWELATRLDGVEEEKIKKSMTGVLSQGNNKFFLDSVNLTGYRNREPLIDVDYHFRVEEYISRYGDEIFVNLNLQKPLQGLKADTTLSEIPVYNDFHFTQHITTVLQLPDGYEVDHLPDNSRFDSERFGFSISYNLAGREVILTNSVRMGLLMLNDDEIGTWNQMIDQLSKSYRETIVLRRDNFNK